MAPIPITDITWSLDSLTPLLAIFGAAILIIVLFSLSLAFVCACCESRQRKNANENQSTGEKIGTALVIPTVKKRDQDRGKREQEGRGLNVKEASEQQQKPVRNPELRNLKKQRDSPVPLPSSAPGYLESSSSVIRPRAMSKERIGPIQTEAPRKALQKEGDRGRGQFRRPEVQERTVPCVSDYQKPDQKGTEGRKGKNDGEMVKMENRPVISSRPSMLSRLDSTTVNITKLNSASVLPEDDSEFWLPPSLRDLKKTVDEEKSMTDDTLRDVHKLPPASGPPPFFSLSRNLSVVPISEMQTARSMLRDMKGKRMVEIKEQS